MDVDFKKDQLHLVTEGHVNLTEVIDKLVDKLEDSIKERNFEQLIDLFDEIITYVKNGIFTHDNFFSHNLFVYDSLLEYLQQFESIELRYKSYECLDTILENIQQSSTWFLSRNISGILVLNIFNVSVSIERILIIKIMNHQISNINFFKSILNTDFYDNIFKFLYDLVNDRSENEFVRIVLEHLTMSVVHFSFFNSNVKTYFIDFCCFLISSDEILYYQYTPKFLSNIHCNKNNEVFLEYEPTILNKLKFSLKTVNTEKLSYLLDSILIETSSVQSQNNRIILRYFNIKEIFVLLNQYINEPDDILIKLLKISINLTNYDNATINVIISTKGRELLNICLQKVNNIKYLVSILCFSALNTLEFESSLILLNSHFMMDCFSVIEQSSPDDIINVLKILGTFLTESLKYNINKELKNNVLKSVYEFLENLKHLSTNNSKWSDILSLIDILEKDFFIKI